MVCCFFFFFFNDTATTEIYTLSLHDALPIYIYGLGATMFHLLTGADPQDNPLLIFDFSKNSTPRQINPAIDRKSTRLNSSHSQISYAVFCLKKKKEPLARPSRRVPESTPLDY